MAGRGGIYPWRLISYLQNYLSKYSASSTLEIEKDVSRILSSSKETIPTNYLQKQLGNYTYSNEPNSADIYSKDSGNYESANPPGTKLSYSDVKNALRSLNYYLPQLPPIQLSFKTKENSASSIDPPMPAWKIRKREVVSKSSVDARTRHLLRAIVHSPGTSLLKKVEDLCSHLKLYPVARGGAIKSSGVPKLLRVLHQTDDEFIRSHIYEALTLLGYAHPVKGHGIRILSIDGGGVRGLVALEILRDIEAKAGQPIHELFDVVCGVSTGAIAAVLIGAHRLSLDSCQELYRDISGKIFSQNTFKGTANLMWNSSYYDSGAWTEVLKTHMGDFPLIETSRKLQIPKICLVSTLVNTNSIQAFLFRNYELPCRVASHFKGTSAHKLWEAVRASAAAPGYFSEFKVGDMILLDGGILVNNPAAIGVHEARHLWQDTPIQSVISIGTGRHVPLTTVPGKSINWASRLKTVIDSATDTEAVHTTLNDLLPVKSYFRFNPYLSEEITLSEIREEKLSTMMEDTRLYIRKNQNKVDDAVSSLLTRKTMLDKTMDYLAMQKLVWRD